MRWPISARWLLRKDSPLHNPADLLRSVTSGIASKPLSFIAMESTANGTGNFFHREWMRACTPGRSDKIPFFVPRHEIDINRSEVDDPQQLWDSLDAYERSLWTDHGCTHGGHKVVSRQAARFPRPPLYESRISHRGRRGLRVDLARSLRPG